MFTVQFNTSQKQSVVYKSEPKPGIYNLGIHLELFPVVVYNLKQYFAVIFIPEAKSGNFLFSICILKLNLAVLFVVFTTWQGSNTFSNRKFKDLSRTYRIQRANMAATFNALFFFLPEANWQFFLYNLFIIQNVFGIISPKMSLDVFSL